MRAKTIRFSILAVLIPFGLIVCFDSQAQQTESSFAPTIPKTWDEAALADWATPVAGLNVRPTHISAKEYYSMTVENLRTYPVYFPGREPEGYWDMLQRVGPQPLIEPEKLKDEADWIEAGRRVFQEADHLHLRTLDSKIIAAVRSPETFKNAEPLADGSVPSMRWVPTKSGVALSFSNCSNCHVLPLPGGARIPGAPEFGTGAGSQDRARNPARTLRKQVYLANGVTEIGDAPFLTGPEPPGMMSFQAFGVPWRKDDINERFKTLTEAEGRVLLAAFLRSGGLPRWNGSLYYPAKIPDLIGIKDRKYIDHTATHLHRGIGDLMRYAALVSFADLVDFGPYHMLSPETRRVQARLSDEALYALALYIYSLKPPPNPNPFDEKAKAGEKIFAREGCATCHTPPLYTNNKLTLAEGFTSPKDAPASLDIMPMSVGTDPGLALNTRKGTGYYKVPSLKGVWYRGHYLHDGSAPSLEEMFDPDRLKETHKPGGWSPPGAETRAIKGHEFGLRLSAEERAELIAFLRAL
jgi:mono/diheme cytochrome c family protein